ncbi:MAG: hypothetical protein EZS28_031038 [Streblomastix strix]|uniref:Right handed beta helix domain-containing protein n=1 Tax=Streblomastix strix TaxID=222440 RepID=A0A5J4UUL4_9EUKA|nr:MAG: hypothetical protein EZS28_031038 [Streblomastix strix]
MIYLLILIQCLFSIQLVRSLSNSEIKGTFESLDVGSSDWVQLLQASSWPGPSMIYMKFTYNSDGLNKLETFQFYDAQYFQYFEEGGVRNIPLFQTLNGHLQITLCQISNVTLEDCSLIELSGPSSGIRTTDSSVELNFCYFLNISLRNSPDFHPCCVILCKVTDISNYASFSVNIGSCMFVSISAGKTDDPTFQMTSASDYAPVMITYKEYPYVQTSECNCVVQFDDSLFISSHGSHTGAIYIRGEIGTVLFNHLLFSRTVAEDGFRYTPDAVYGNVIYVSGSDDIMRMASEYFYLCRSDSDAPKIAVQSSNDMGMFDYLIPDFQQTIVVSVTGSDSIGTGSQQYPLRTVQSAVQISNPKKTEFVEKLVDLEEYPITVIIKDGYYIESNMKINSQRISLKGNGISSTFLRNDINSQFNPSVLIQIEPDNNHCKLDITDISFEQQFYDASTTDALILVQYGEVILLRCSFTQFDSNIVHYSPFIQLKEKGSALYDVTFNNGNFSKDTAAVDVVTEGGGQFYNCSFVNIKGAASLRVDLSYVYTSLLLQNCIFHNCTSLSSSSSLSGSTIIVTNTILDDYSTNQVKIVLNSPVCTFTRCQFTDNAGKSEVKFLGKLMFVGFVQCNIDSTSISYDSLWTSTYWDEIKYFSFGGCSGSASNATLYINSTGLDSGTGTISSPLHSITQAINQKTQGGQSLLTLQIGSGTWEDDGLMIGARSISLQGSGVNDTLLMNKITTRIWLACVIGGKLSIQNAGLRQASSSEYYGGMLILRGNGNIELTNVVFKQREQIINQSSSTIYASGGIIIKNCVCYNNGTSTQRR